MKDLNKAYTWPLDPFPAGASIWPKMAGRLTGFGESHYQFLPDYFCPHIILRGRGTVRAAGSEWRVETGDMFTLWPGARIEYFEDAGDPWEYLWMHLTGAGVPDYVAACGFAKNEPVHRAARPDDVIERFTDVHEAFERRIPSEAYAVLARLYELPPLCASPAALARPPRDPRRELVARVTATLESLLHTSLNIKELSNMFQVSRITLFRAFTSELGVSPLAYLDRLRIAKAERLLAETDHPVAFVARSCGFSNPKYFMRRFKEAKGATPTEYRSRN